MKSLIPIKGSLNSMFGTPFYKKIVNRYMKTSDIFPLLFSSLILCIVSCTNAQTKNIASNSTDTITLSPPPLVYASLIDTTQNPHQMIDPRDGETYAIVKIGNQTWMAENLRYDAPNSIVQPNNPLKKYGLLYQLMPAQVACPTGWHLPSDAEWDELEMAHGMPASFIGQGGWRGEHAVNMKSTIGWADGENGMDSLGFNVIPAGYFFDETVGEEAAGFEGLGYCAAYWSSIR